MGHTIRSIEDSSAEVDLINCVGLAQEVSEEKNINMWPNVIVLVTF